MKLSPSALAIACSLLAAACLPRAAAAVETIPFTDDAGLMRVQGSIDGQPPVPMLVDLGAGVDIVSERLAHLVAIDGKYTTLRLTGQRVDLPMGNVVTLDLGGVRIAQTAVAVWSGLAAARGVDGLISANAFRNTATTFDFADRQIVLEDAVTLPERKRTASYVPLVLQDDLDTALGVFARFDIGNGRTALCEIDTGTKGILFDNVFRSGGVPSMTLVGAPQTALAHPAVKYGNLIYDCIAGLDFWRGRTFTLDVLNRAMYVAQQG
jgi:hypothetical protein